MRSIRLLGVRFDPPCGASEKSDLILREIYTRPDILRYRFEIFLKQGEFSSKAQMSRLAAALGLSRVPVPMVRTENSSGAPILLYHRFDPRLAVTPWTMVTDVFRDQLHWLGANGYRIVTVRSAVQ